MGDAVREDYSPDADPWAYFPHDHARSRSYRWGEDGLLGITDREGDPILKERLFGLAGADGDHGSRAAVSAQAIRPAGPPWS